MRSRMDRLFGGLLDVGSDLEMEMPTYRLPIDVSETDNAYVIKAPVPGFKPEEVEVTLEGDVLSINARHVEEKTSEKDRFLRREIAMGNLERHIVLPADARSENIKASFANGVLKVEVPRSPRPAPQRIQIRSEERKQIQGAA
jgi:HSP20 family protein